MNVVKTGLIIAKKRHELGLTQRELARELSITDKAISKWERGLCAPDVALLPKISRLLNVDLDFLISTNSEFNTDWNGLLIISSRISISTQISGKPILDYLLSYFMLVGIKTISIVCSKDSWKYINNRNLGQYGLKIQFGRDSLKHPLMIVYGEWMLFGPGLTSLLQSAMRSNQPCRLVFGNKELPFVFSPKGEACLSETHENELKIRIGRGFIAIPLDCNEGINESSIFVDFYNRTQGNSIADLKEIAINRGLIES